jgi:myo-inositol 2-dehydrogenase / D-chiro-inositol 1-dehydrogenase
MMRVGVLGAGRHSVATHGPALKILHGRAPGEIDLAAVCDLDARRAENYAEKFGFRRVYSDVDQMLEEERLDALFAITPLPLTEVIAASLLPHGIPLLIEKPPGTNSAATRRLLDIARASNTAHMVSFNRRFNPAVREAQAWLAEAPEERRPHSLLGRMVRHARLESDFAVGTGIHLIDALLSFTGAPTRISSQRISTGNGGSFFFSALVECEAMAAQVAISPSAGVREETIEIHGAGYTLKIDTFANQLQIFQENRLVREWRPAGGISPDLLDVVAETEYFLEGVRLGRPLCPNLQDGLLSVLAAEAIQQGGVTELTEAGLSPRIPPAPRP